MNSVSDGIYWIVRLLINARRRWSQCLCGFQVGYNSYRRYIGCDLLFFCHSAAYSFPSTAKLSLKRRCGNPERRSEKRIGAALESNLFFLRIKRKALYPHAPITIIGQFAQHRSLERLLQFRRVYAWPLSHQTPNVTQQIPEVHYCGNQLPSRIPILNHLHTLTA